MEQNPFNPMPEASNKLLLISGRYRLGRSLGRGSFGQVFQAEDIKYKPPRLVALKLLHQKFLGEPGLLNDIEHEASVLAQFSHPNILQIYDFEVSHGQAYIVTALAEGGSLAGKLRPDPSKSPIRLPFEVVSRYLEQIASAIDEAHSHNLVHRDLKPLNILLDKWGHPLVADFGLATALTHSQSSVIMEVGTSGTPSYMAPEQWNGQAGKASDIYALAVMIYQMLTGQLPFQGDSNAQAYQHINAPVPPLSLRAPELPYPPALDSIFAPAMAKDPHERTRPALEFYRRFQFVLSPGASETRGTGPSKLTETASAFPQNHPTPVIRPLSPTRVYTPIPLQTNPPEGVSNNREVGLEPIYANTEVSSQGVRFNQITAEPAPLRTHRGLNPGVIVGIVLSLILLGVAIFLLLLNLLRPTIDDKTSTSIAVVTSSFIKTTLTTVNSTQPGLINSLPPQITPDTTLLISPPVSTVNLLITPSITSVPTTIAITTPPSNFSTTSANSTTVGSLSTTIKSTQDLPARELNTLIDHKDSVYNVVWSPDGKVLASTSRDKTVRLWNATGQLLATLPGYPDVVNDIAWSPDSKMLATAADDNTVRLWDASGRPLVTIQGHTKLVYTIAWSPDSKALATGSGDNTIKLWNLDGGQLFVNTLSKHTGSINSLAWSPDGKILASASQDKTIRLWNPFLDG